MGKQEKNNAPLYVYPCCQAVHIKTEQYYGRRQNLGFKSHMKEEALHSIVLRTALEEAMDLL